MAYHLLQRDRAGYCVWRNPEAAASNIRYWVQQFFRTGSVAASAKRDVDRCVVEMPADLLMMEHPKHHGSTC
jgi:hypothetical protein